MAIFKRIPHPEIRATFTHRAVAFGWLPIYYNRQTYQFAVRNGLPDCLADLAHATWEFWCMCRFALQPDWECKGLPILLTREV